MKIEEIITLISSHDLPLPSSKVEGGNQSVTNQYLKPDHYILYNFIDTTVADDSFLLAFCKDYKSDDEKGKQIYEAPFVPITKRCNGDKIYFSNRLFLPYNKSGDNVVFSTLFYFQSPPPLSNTFSVMILHHANLIDISKKNTQNKFKDFLDFASKGFRYHGDNHFFLKSSECSFVLQGNDGIALEFARKNGIEEKGLLFVKDIDEIEKEFSESFEKLLFAMSGLFKNSVNAINDHNDDYISYKKAFDEFYHNSQKYTQLNLRDEESQYFIEPDEKRCFLCNLTNAVRNLNVFVESVAKHQPCKYLSEQMVYCACVLDMMRLV